MMNERFTLAAARIAEIEQETALAEPYRGYFQKTAAFLRLTIETADFATNGAELAAIAELAERNFRLYEEILPAGYETSFTNPTYAVKVFGEEYGRLLSFLAAELRSLIAFAHEGRLDRMVIRMELFLEIYSAFLAAGEDFAHNRENVLSERDDDITHNREIACGKTDTVCGEIKNDAIHSETADDITPDREAPGRIDKPTVLPDYEELRQIIYWFAGDYAEAAAVEKVAALVDADRDFALRLIMDSDLADFRYLYRYGEYVTENEIATAKHLLALPEETLRLLADTLTEGFRKGFEVTGRDLSKKKTVNVRYCLGFERVVRQVILNFTALGLRTSVCRAAVTVLEGKGVSRVGYYGAIPNKQYDYDHKDDQALILDKQLVTRRLEALKAAYEQYRQPAAVFAGPAVIEVFGENPQSPLTKKEALQLSDKQQQLVVEYTSAAGELQNRYIPGEERSFTIIAFPTPEIGPQFAAIFDETVRINTLDYNLYRNLQQILIDTLDQGEYVRVKGAGANRTDLKICLRPLTDPAAETNFENCVADVNIPVGEVFTSPRLSGTEGILHVTRVFLNDLEYKDIMLTIKDGMVTDYGCANFATPEENRKYVRDNVLHHHPSLPMGEFAIGTNTTAYMVGKKYDIAHRFPILIAEKTGPHFAFGDTCYSHAEEVAVFNPDGKEIVARDNEISLLRKSDAAKAYFNCHTDITIPYDELGELTVVTAAGEQIILIENGRFVLPGCDELNKPFD